MIHQRWIVVFYVFLIFLLGIGLVVYSRTNPRVNRSYRFDSRRAIQHVEFQVALGARIPGSQAHAQTVDWIASELLSDGWEVEIQQTAMMGHPIRNIVARWGRGHPWIILGAHYDSRIMADRDPDPSNWNRPVPGANDGASGVATLLELGRVLPYHLDQKIRMKQGGVRQVWLVFFDAEDNGKLPGWDWILGSRAFVSSLNELPDAAVIVDMIGDKDLKIYQEKNSDPGLNKEIWAYAAKLDYSDFLINRSRYRILDDHIPFIETGVPAITIIDFDYPFWHTIADTPDKVASHSLEVVGETLLLWITDTQAFSESQ